MWYWNWINFKGVNDASIVVLFGKWYNDNIILFEAGKSIIYKLIVIDELAPATPLGLSILTVIDIKI